MYTNLGPGDPETWGPCTGHPHDPRTVFSDEELQDAEADVLIDKALADDTILDMLIAAGAVDAADLDELGDLESSGDLDGPLTASYLLGRFDPQRTKLHEWLAETGQV